MSCMDGPWSNITGEIEALQHFKNVFLICEFQSPKNVASGIIISMNESFLNASCCKLKRTAETWKAKSEWNHHFNKSLYKETRERDDWSRSFGLYTELWLSIGYQVVSNCTKPVEPIGSFAGTTFCKKITQRETKIQPLLNKLFTFQFCFTGQHGA